MTVRFDLCSAYSVHITWPLDKENLFLTLKFLAPILNKEPASFQPTQTSDKLKGSQSSLPSYNEATEGVFNKKEKVTVKKKIIPVQSDYDSSPSPEYPSSPIASPPVYQKNRFRMSQSTINLAQQEDGEVREW